MAPRPSHIFFWFLCSSPVPTVPFFQAPFHLHGLRGRKLAQFLSLLLTKARYVERVDDFRYYYIQYLQVHIAHAYFVQTAMFRTRYLTFDMSYVTSTYHGWSWRM